MSETVNLKALYQKLTAPREKPVDLNRAEIAAIIELIAKEAGIAAPAESTQRSLLAD